MHEWGDEGVDFKGIEDAADMIHDFCVKYARLGGQSKEKYGCYDKDTEVLTKAGWKFFKDISLDVDEFATLSDNHYLEYQKAYDYVEYEYQGPMYQLKTRGVDLLVTPNHNLYAARGDTNGGVGNKYKKTSSYALQNYKELYRSPKKFIKGAKWIGNSIEFIDVPEYTNTWNNRSYSTRTITKEALRLDAKKFLRLLGWFVAEGSYSNDNTSDLTIHAEEVEELSRLLDSLGIKFKVQYRPPYGAVIHLYDIQLHNFFLENCGKLAFNKKAPEFIKDLSPDLIKEFLIGLYDGDGNKTETANVLSTVSKSVADGVLELLLKAGYCGRISIRDRRNDIPKFIDGRRIKPNYASYDINWLSKTEHHSLNSHDSEEKIKSKENIVDYSGMVYCVSVPNKTLYVRRNGIPVWCGNSVRFYASFGLSLHSLFYPGHYFYRLPKWLVTADIYIITPFFQKSGLQWLWYKWQQFIYRLAYKKALNKFPHLRKEILCCADYPELLEGI